VTGEWTLRRPVWAIAAALLAAATIPAMFVYQYRREWTELQRYYLGSYVQSGVFAWTGWDEESGSQYLMLDVVAGKRRQRPAFNSEVDGVERAGPSGEPVASYALSPQGLAAGGKRLVWQSRNADNAKLYRFLRQGIYDGRSLPGLAWPACEWGLGVLVAGLGSWLAAALLEWKRSRPPSPEPWERRPEAVRAYAPPPAASAPPKLEPAAGAEKRAGQPVRRPAPEPVRQEQPYFFE
jgi:hypothetical protein